MLRQLPNVKSDSELRECRVRELLIAFCSVEISFILAVVKVEP